jgi:hypothetical protein
MAGHLGTEHRAAAAGHAGDRVDELADVGHAVLQQVAHALEGSGGLGLGVLGEHQHAQGQGWSGYAQSADLLAQPSLGERPRQPAP